jgi:curved DNA-binding protein CbpA
MSVHTDLYEVLGVAPTASAADLGKAYRELLWRFHPDTRGDSPPDTGSEEPVEAIRNLVEAYAVLRDPARRAEYDRQLARESSVTRDVDPPAQRLDLLRAVSAVRWHNRSPRRPRPEAWPAPPGFTWWFER